jgi:peroxiredoxin
MHRLLLCFVIAAGVYSQAPAGPMSTTLKVGDTAPDFTLPSTSGKPVTLADFRGKKTVVLAFFPAAFTGGCTAEMQKYQLGADKFQTGETQVFGISEDNSPSQKEFAAKLNLAFPLLSDFADRYVATEYGVLIPVRGIANRVTFVIDPEGKIAFMEQGKDAIETMGAAEACGRLAHRAAASK